MHWLAMRVVEESAGMTILRLKTSEDSYDNLEAVTNE